MPDLALPSHTALRLGAIHNGSSVPNQLYVENVPCFCMCAHAFGMGHSTLTRFDPLELICAEPDPVSGGTRLAKYPSSCQPSLGRKSEVVASPLPSRVPKRGRNCAGTAAF